MLIWGLRFTLRPALLCLVSTPVRGHARVDILGVGVGWGGVGWDVSVHCDCNHAVCSLALPHIRHATSQNSLLCWWLQSLERSLQTTSARKTPQMAKLCPQPRWVYEALGGKPTKKSSSLAGTQTLEVLVCCGLAQERQRQCPEQPWTTLCLKGKKELFGETLDEQNSCFVLVRH